MLRKAKHYIATCAGGLENLVSGEISSLGARVTSSSPGAVLFTGPLESAYRACLWSRYAARILLVLEGFPARTTDDLYRGALGVDWDRHFGVDDTFAVDCTLRRSPIHHSRYASLRIKDAVADQFRERHKLRPSVAVVRPDVRIHLFLDREEATLCLDMSGESLHLRGYRTAGAEAPLKESLAAAIVHLAGWSHEVQDGAALLDPLCGSGTLLTEAAFMYADIAPGLGREYFGFSGWRGHRKAVWNDLVREARSRKRQGLKRPRPHIIGYDADRRAIAAALENVRQAGLEAMVHVERREIARLENPFAGRAQCAAATGLIVANPPYGERMGTLQATRYLYRCLGRVLRTEFHGWQAGVLTTRAELADEIFPEKKKTYQLYNGPLVCRLYVAAVPRMPAVNAEAPLRVSGRAKRNSASDFANRLSKNVHTCAEWAARTKVTCYRVYDGDIPEYNVAVDMYGPRVHLQEYAPPKTVDPARAAARLDHAVQTVRDVLGVPDSRLFVKVRRRQKGPSQYQKQGSSGRLYEVGEHGGRFLVNLSDYLDTGLFLDHRITRDMIRNLAAGKRFLNLFAYTGTASVFAAAGGAKLTTSVDLSPVYLEWARSNLALNGFSDVNNRTVQADCMTWLAETGMQFDLIFADPPTFSNSKRTGRVFDVQRDHVALIQACIRRLEHDGLLLFSTNSRRFRMDSESLSGLHLENISSETIPYDFRRRPRIHQCWRIRRKS